MTQNDTCIRVLVVEDEAIVAVDIAEGLKNLGYAVCGTASNGARAIELAKQQSPDVILMDIRLQGKMTGIEAAQAIKKDLQIPVIFLTAHSDESTIQSAKAAEPFGYLIKPFGIREIRAAIETALYKFEADKRVAESEKWNRLIIETAHSAFVAMDSDGIITDWNPAAEKTFGWKKEEVIGKPMAPILIPQRLRQLHSEGFNQYLTTGTQRIMGKAIEMYALTKEGNEIPVEITVTSASVKDRKFFMAFVQDISLRKINEIQKKRTEELERSNEELERFAHLASHDLQEPLRTVAMFTQLLESRLGDHLTPEQREMMGHVVQGANRMSLLVQDLLRYAKAGAQMEEELVPVDLNKIIREVKESLTSKILETQTQITVHHLPTVLGHADKLRQVFQNLFSNSMKFTREKPNIIEVGAKKKGPYWEVYVKDNGIGFNTRYHDQIFEIFKRLNSTDNYPGSGIGLALCKKIVQLHGGEIHADSSPGVGSTFYLSLPRTDATTLVGTLEGMKLLVVDDSKESRALVTQLLRKTGASIDYASSGVEALELNKQRHYDVILMDIEMPGMTGIETAVRLKQQGTSAPVIAFTGHDVLNIRKDCENELFKDFVSKSLPAQRLVDHLRMWWVNAA